MEVHPLNTSVRFADGFDRPDTIAFGLEGPQLAVVAAGATLAWALLHAPAPAGLQVAAAALVAATCGVVGAGRWAGRPLLIWAWIAGRFWISPRTGGGPLLARSSGDGAGGRGTGGEGPPRAAGAGRFPGGPPPGGSGPDGPEQDEAQPDGSEAAAASDVREPGWARWLREGGVARRGRDQSAGEPARGRPGSPQFVWQPPVEPGADAGGGEPGDAGADGGGWTYGTPGPGGRALPAQGSDRAPAAGPAGGGVPSFVLQPPLPAAPHLTPGRVADPATGQRSAAVEMWLAALGGGRVATPGVRHGIAAAEVVDLSAFPARDQLGGAVRAGAPPVASPVPSTGAVAPSAVSSIARRVVDRFRRGRAESPAAESPWSETGAAPAAASYGGAEEAGHPVAGSAPPSVGGVVEIDRPPLLLVGRPATRGDESLEGRPAPPVAPLDASTDAEVGAGDDEPQLGTVIPLIHRFNESLDEELMRELEGSGGDDPVAADRSEGSASGTATAGGEPPDPARTPVFVGATRRICFFSLNGGSGRTTLATEIACLLAARGRHRPDPQRPPERLRVALVDLDMRSSNVAVRLGIPRPTVWDYLLATGAEADDVRRFLVTHPSGLRALLGPPKPLSTAAAAVEPARIAEIVHQLERDGCHFLVFDVGSDLGAVSTWVLSQVHDIYVVITPTGSGMQDAYRTTETLRRLGLGHKLRYVVNRARGTVDLDEVMSDLGGRVVATIPYDHRLEDAENAHRIASLQGGGPAAQAIVRLASTIYPTIGEPRARRGLIGRRHAG